jgi:UDP-N-acetylmuramate dehydrogenase
MRDQFNGDLRFNEPMSKHTSLRVGGPAEQFFIPHSVEDLSIFLKTLDSNLPILWLGRGSNLLVRDGGLSGVVVATSKISNVIEKVGKYLVRVGASIPCTKFARQCIRWKLGPSEFFSGIPGTIGGALSMNAGAFGYETWDNVSEVHTINREGEIKTRNPKDYQVSYRNVLGPENEWFIEAKMLFDPKFEASMEKQKDIINARKNTQPIGLPSCGSVFQNPPGDFAARLIESANLKGYRIGGAEISSKHANFVINVGSATAEDIEKLILFMRKTVLKVHNVMLKKEVRIVGSGS